MPTEAQLQEIHRLAVLGAVANIAQQVGPWLTGAWLATSRFREVRKVSLQTLALGPHAQTLNDLAYAKQRLGEVQDALEHYTTATALYQEAGDRAGLAATLNNIGTVYNGLGDRQQALHYYQQALTITEEVVVQRAAAFQIKSGYKDRAREPLGLRRESSIVLAVPESRKTAPEPQAGLQKPLVETLPQRLALPMRQTYPT
jgi:tetratricopeptide (TPR) repeat protein